MLRDKEENTLRLCGIEKKSAQTFLSPYINGEEFDILVRFVEERKETILIHNIITLVLSFYEEYFEIFLINIYLQMVAKVALL